MTDKLEHLKRQQDEIQRLIKLEELKQQKELIQNQIDGIAPASMTSSELPNLSPSKIRQETYKGKIVNLENDQYRVSGVAQLFSTLEQAKRHIDSNMGYQNSSGTKSNDKIPKNKKWIQIAAVAISVTVLINFMGNFIGSSGNKVELLSGQRDVLIDVALGNITPDRLAITHLNKRFEFMGQITGRTTEGNATIVSLENGRAFCSFTDQSQRLAVSEIGRSCWLWTGTLSSVGAGRLNFTDCAFRHC